jgi:hypothetical protein
MIETWELLDNSVGLAGGCTGRLFKQTLDFGEPTRKVVIYHVLASVASWNEKNAAKRGAE